MKKIVLIFLLSIFVLGANAGNGEKIVSKSNEKMITGSLKAANGEEIPAARITIVETGESIFTDFSGNFSLKLKTDKVYSITIETIGFEPRRLKSNELHLFNEIDLKPL